MVARAPPFGEVRRRFGSLPCLSSRAKAHPAVVGDKNRISQRVLAERDEMHSHTVRLARHSKRSPLAVVAASVCLLGACGADSELASGGRTQAEPTPSEGELGANGVDVDLGLFTTLEADSQWEVAAAATPSAVVVIEGGAPLDQGLRPVLHVGRSDSPNLERIHCRSANRYSTSRRFGATAK